jgi:anti-sigma factor RsiW
MPMSARGLAAVATGIAAAVALFLALPQVLYHGTQDELVASHVRSLLASHLTDVQNSDQHVVKPWFNGKIDFVPPVPELKADGFPLAGGRLDYVDNKVIAAIVYHRRLHPINLFVRPVAATTLPFAYADQQDGYNILRWRKNGLEFWAVSDLNPKELKQFRDCYEKAP